jgi:hypothetical protein
MTDEEKGSFTDDGGVRRLIAFARLHAARIERRLH